MSQRDSLKRLTGEIVDCTRCPRLREYGAEVARVKRRAYRDQDYWGRPVPGFGAANARVLFVGLAPGAHGAHRTGRLFTGDRSGEWLYAALHRAGFSNQPTSTGPGDGLKMNAAYITNVARCAPPQNKPAVDEIANCSDYLQRELVLLRSLRVVVALGGIAWNAILRHARSIDRAAVPTPAPKFGHGSEATLPLVQGRAPVTLLGCYHPSQQNTQTGRLTRPMLDRVFRRAERLSSAG